MSRKHTGIRRTPGGPMPVPVVPPAALVEPEPEPEPEPESEPEPQLQPQPEPELQPVDNEIPQTLDIPEGNPPTAHDEDQQPQPQPQSQPQPQPQPEPQPEPEPERQHGEERPEPAPSTTLLPLSGDEFPDEALAAVCCFLGPRELGRLACVSRRFTERTLTEPGGEWLSVVEEGARLHVKRLNEEAPAAKRRTVTWLQLLAERLEHLQFYDRMIRRCMEPTIAASEGAQTAVVLSGGPSHEIGLGFQQQIAFQREVSQEDILRVLDQAKQVLLTQPSLLELATPINIVGDIRGYDHAAPSLLKESLLCWHALSLSLSLSLSIVRSDTN